MLLQTLRNRSIYLSSVVMRTPSIRFRYGASKDSKSPAGAPPAAAGGGRAAAAPSGASGASIYDFQIPERWRRRPISDEEIAYINRGGPE